MALLLFALVVLILLWPLIARIARILFVAHAWLVVLFLPAGLLVRYGQSRDMRLFVAATLVWALAVLALHLRAGRVAACGRRRGHRLSDLVRAA